MMPVIRIDDEVWSWLKSKAGERPFEDTTPNAVLRRVAGLGSGSGAKTLAPERLTRQVDRRPSGKKTPQHEFRAPIIQILVKKNGCADRTFVLSELERLMAHRLTDFDRKHIKSGVIRWQKSAEWEVSTMRQAGLLLPQSRSPRGVWCLSPDGERSARSSNASVD